jgi:hypothetical protein
MRFGTGARESCRTLNITSIRCERPKPCAAEVLAQDLKQELFLCVEGRDFVEGAVYVPT